MKMHITIYLIFIFIQNNLCDDSNESKYIDLLPEEEKEQFLQKIARRIFEETEVTDDNYKQSREVSDDQLNEHTEFVKKILREESANLRKQSRDVKKTEDKSEEYMRVKPLVKDKISEDRVHDEDRYVDLTLRQGSRKKRTGHFNSDIDQNTGEKVEIDVKYDTEENKVTENGETSSHLAEVQRPELSEESVNKKDQSSFEDIQVKQFNRKHDIDMNQSAEIVSTSNKPRMTQMTDFDAESLEKVSIEHTTPKNVSENTEGLETTISEGIVGEKVETSSRRYTESIYEPIIKDSVKHESTTENIATTNVIEATTVEKHSTANITYNQELNHTKRVLRSEYHNKTTINLADDENYAPKEKLNATTIYKEEPAVQILHTTESNRLIENYNINTDNLGDVEIKLNKSALDNTLVQIVANVGNDTDQFTNNSNSKIYKVTKAIMYNKNQTEVISNSNNNEIKNTSNSNNGDENKHGADIIKSNISYDPSMNDNVADDVIKALRLRLLGDDERSGSYEINGNVENNVGEPLIHKKNQTYNVYELPSNQEPFTKRNKIGKYKNQEQPHYIPIYNYSPNNAYFNAQNRYGPNIERTLELEERDSDIEFHDTPRNDDIYFRKENFQALRHRDANRKFRFGNRESPKRTHKVPPKLLPVINQKQHFPEVFINPDDYLDTDYYFGRTNTHFRSGSLDESKKFPESDEELHPHVDRIKDHIRSVRKILFKNQIFGYVPPVNGSHDVTPPAKPMKVTQMPPYRYLKRNSYKNKKADYYFERTREDDKDMRVGYVKYNNLFQDLHVTKNISEELMKKVNVIKFANHLFFRDGEMSANKSVKSLRNRTTIFSQDDSHDYHNTITKVLKLTNEIDLFPTLEKMRGMNIPYTRSRYVSENVTVYLEVLSDILKTDSKPFIQYDWLGTTVDIQSALTRLTDMTEAVQNKIVIHPADFGLLKYTVYLFQTAKTTLYMENEKSEIKLTRMGIILPRNRKRKRMFLKEKGLLNRVWLFKRHNMIESGVLNEFNKFLCDLQGALFDLHSAIKHIALITKYSDQAWFKHLQKVYLQNDKKHLLAVTLHLTTSRLFGLIEGSAKNGVEINMVDYLQNNDKQVDRSIDEFVFVLRLLDEIKYMKN